MNWYDGHDAKIILGLHIGFWQPWIDRDIMSRFNLQILMYLWNNIIIFISILLKTIMSKITFDATIETNLVILELFVHRFPWIHIMRFWTYYILNLVCFPQILWVSILCPIFWNNNWLAMKSMINLLDAILEGITRMEII
jgi:hypothetical protein